jgi:hypothetical protein
MRRPTLQAIDAARRLILGEAGAFEEIVRIYTPRLRESWWCQHHRLDPDDFVQETWLNCWLRLPRLLSPLGVERWVWASAGTAVEQLRHTMERRYVSEAGPRAPLYQLFQQLTRSIPDNAAQLSTDTNVISIRLSAEKEMAKLPPRWFEILYAGDLVGYTRDELNECLPYGDSAIHWMGFSARCRIAKAWRTDFPGARGSFWPGFATLWLRHHPEIAATR